MPAAIFEMSGTEAFRLAPPIGGLLVSIVGFVTQWQRFWLRDFG